MQFRVGGAAPDPSRVPAKLRPVPKLRAPTRIAQTWNFGLGGNRDTGTFWSINGKSFKAERVDYEVPLGSTQTWKLRNTSEMTHYVHIHAEQWHTVSRDGKRPPAEERGLEDTWRLDPGEVITVAARFADYTGPFMIHCHMLDHEDHGMMATFAVVDRRRGASGRPAQALSEVASGHHSHPAGGHHRVGGAQAQAVTAERFLRRSGGALGVQAGLALLLVGGFHVHRRRRPGGTRAAHG